MDHGGLLDIFKVHPTMFHKLGSANHDPFSMIHSGTVVLVGHKS